MSKLTLNKGRKSFEVSATSKGEAPKGGYKFQVTIKHLTNGEVIKGNYFCEVGKSGTLSNSRLEEAFGLILGAAKAEVVAKFLGYTTDKGLNHVPTWIAWAVGTKGDIPVSNPDKPKAKADAKPKAKKETKPASKLADKAPKGKAASKKQTKKAAQPKAEKVVENPPSAVEGGNTNVLERLLTLAEKQQSTIDKIVELAK